MSAGDSVLRAELEDLRVRLVRERRRHQRHLLWVVAGASPGAFLPMLFVLSEFGGAALATVVVGVTVVEGWRALRSKREIRALETLEMELLDLLDTADPGVLS